jgi:hypothetical protein
MMVHLRLTAILHLVAFVVPITAGNASAQAIGSTVFSGLSIPPSLLQPTAPPPPQPGGAPFAPNLTMPTAGLAPDVVLVPLQARKSTNSAALGHKYDGPAIVLDDQALQGVH